MTASYERKEGRQELHGQLLRVQVVTVGPGRVTMAIVITTRPFHRRDDWIVCLALHQHVRVTFGHDMIIDAWWASP